MAEQMAFYVECARCRYGRDFGGNDYGCENQAHYADIEQRVHRGNFACPYGREKENANM